MWNYNYYVYIMSNPRDTVLYIGFTSDLKKRVLQHKGKVFEGFSKKYNTIKLVYYEYFDDVHAAIAREKQLKSLTRAKKETIIKKMNPKFDDLTSSIG